jgi:glycerophosphoryl diester phosphodiesterase
MNKKILAPILFLCLSSCASLNVSSLEVSSSLEEVEPSSSIALIEPSFYLNVKTIAHQGYHVSTVPNTIKSFIEAGKRYFYGIETDIYLTKDKHWVINHDARITSMDKDIVDATLEEVLAVNISNTYDEDVYICQFEDYLEVCKTYNKIAFVELKMMPELDELYALLDYISSQGMGNKTCIISFGLENILRVMDYENEHHIGIMSQYLCQSYSDMLNGSNWGVNLNYYYPYVNEEVIALYHSLGKDVNAWTVDDEKTADSLIAMGVDYITTNWMECGPSYLA